MTLGATLVASFLVTLARPATWVLALLAFLVRGGFLLVVAPILVLPTAVGLANVLAPTLTEAWLNGLTGEVVGAAMAVVAAVVGAIVLGGLLAALAEAELIRIVATDDEVRPAGDGAAGRDPGDGQLVSRPWSAAMRVLAVRLLALAPLALAVATGTVRIVDTAYRELTVPSAGGAPLVVRVLVGAPDAIGLIVLAWAFAEMVGAVAARRVVLVDDGVRRALIGALGQTVRRPFHSIGLFVLPLAAMVVVVAPALVAATTARDAVRTALDESASAGFAVVVVGLFIVLWVAGLVLIGMVGAWRAAAWTVDAAGTFGAVDAADRGVGTRAPGLAP